VLEEEQIAWIAGHHERPDGSGYPAALKGDAVPEGASLLALADAWDVMVSDRSYSAPMTLEQALAEAHACAGTQFDVAAVDALDTLAQRGELMPAAARLHQPTI
jgi:HD-GYP domain-containing protein (c-di-GMP phosphodiesterase class II)